MTASFDYLLWLGDDALIASHRLAEWCAKAHDLEEDMALANVALDQLGQARLLLTYAGEREGAGRDEDALAFGRTEREFRNCQLVELPNGDFATSIAKLLCFAAYQSELYRSLDGADHDRLAEIARKAGKETAYHLDHATMWTLRLGGGTEESHARMQAGIDAVWPYTHELFQSDPICLADPASFREPWLTTVEGVLADAGLARPSDAWAPSGGRNGLHTEAMGYLLAELQYLQRAYPGASW